MDQINSVSLILDILALALAIFIIARAASKGFIASIISFFGGLASIFIAAFLSKPTAEYIYQSFLQEKIISTITESIGNASTSNAAAFLQSLEQSVQSLPAPIVSLLQLNSQSVVTVVTDNIGQSVETISQSLSENVIEPLTVTLISTLLFVILFVVLSLVFRILSKMFVGMKKIPIIGKVNALLGAVFGVLDALIVLYVVNALLYFALTVFGTSLPYLTQESLQSSYIFGWLSSFSFT